MIGVIVKAKLWPLCSLTGTCRRQGLGQLQKHSIHGPLNPLYYSCKYPDPQIGWYSSPKSKLFHSEFGHFILINPSRSYLNHTVIGTTHWLVFGCVRSRVSEHVLSREISQNRFNLEKTAGIFSVNFFCFISFSRWVLWALKASPWYVR